MSSEKRLIKQYEKDFFEKTGKKIEIEVLDDWQSLCRLEGDFTPDVLLNLICTAANWDAKEVFAHCNKPKVVLKRQIVYFILRSNRTPLTKIASLDGRRDHTVVISGLKSFRNKLDTDQFVRSFLRELISTINNNISTFLTSCGREYCA